MDKKRDIRCCLDVVNYADIGMVTVFCFCVPIHLLSVSVIETRTTYYPLIIAVPVNGSKHTNLVERSTAMASQMSQCLPNFAEPSRYSG